MANPDVSPVMVRQFSSMVHVAAQQMESRLKPYLKHQFIKGEDAAYDGIGAVEDAQEDTRYADLVYSAPEWNRRKLSANRFYVAIPFDNLDKLQTLCDPQSTYHQICAAALRRRYDRVAMAAAFASVLTGKNFASTVTFAADGGKTVDATAGLTYEKLLEAEQNFTDGDVGTDQPVKKLIAISGLEHTALMKETELTSGDFSGQYWIDKGEMKKALGFDIIKYGASATNPVLPVASNVRSNLILAEGGISVGVQEELTVEVEKVPGKLRTWHLVVSSVIGAVRTEGKLVQRLTTTVPA